MSGTYPFFSLCKIIIIIFTHQKKKLIILPLIALSALIFGATGQTGRNLLQSLLASPHFTRVGEYGRNVTSPNDIKTGKDKLEQKVIDFEKIQEYGLKQGKWDVVFITYVCFFVSFFFLACEGKFFCCSRADLLLFFFLNCVV